MKPKKQLDILADLDKMMDQVDKINENEDMSETEKMEFAQKQMHEFGKYQKMMEGMIHGFSKKERKAMKLSKYHLSEAIRKYKAFTYTILKIDDDDNIEAFTDDLYNIIAELQSDDDAGKKRRLSQLYGISLRNTLKSFKTNVQSIISECKENGHDVVATVSEFYGVFFEMLVKAVVEKYNNEMVEAKQKMEENEAKRKEEEIKKEVARLDPIIPSSSEALKETEA